MNKLELLAKLKQAYEVLNDILENGDTELPHIAISYIETEYNKVYDEISQTNEDVLFITVKESDYSIGYSANIDYQDRNNGEIYTSGDIGYEWWNDKSLIQQYEKELNNDETRENEPSKDDIKINHMEMGTYEEEDKAQIHTETLVALSKLEDKYNIPANQRVTVYEEVKGDTSSETYPFPRDEKIDTDVEIIYEAFKDLDKARENNLLVVGYEYSQLTKYYTLETIFNMFSKQQKEMIINDVELYGGIVLDENEPPIKLKYDDTMDKLVDMVMSERQQENDEIEME